MSFISLFRATLNCFFRATLNCFFSPMVSTQEGFCFDDLSSAAIYCQLDSANAILQVTEEKQKSGFGVSSIIPVEPPRLLWLLGESLSCNHLQVTALSMSHTPNHSQEHWVVLHSLVIPVPFSYICK